MEWLHLIVLKSHSLPASFTFPHYLSLLNQSTYLLSMLFLCRLPPCRSDGKESACNAGDLGLIPGLGRSPGGGHGNPFHSSCLENLHGQRSLETDTTEHLTHTHTHTNIPTNVKCLLWFLQLWDVMNKLSSYWFLPTPCSQLPRTSYVLTAMVPCLILLWRLCP